MAAPQRAADARRSLTVSAALLWMVGGAGFLLIEACAAAAYPGYSYAHDVVSDLGVAAGSPRADLMNTAFYLQGSLFLAGAVVLGLAAHGGARSLLFVAIVAVNTVGNLLVGAVHGDAGRLHWLHGTGAALAFVGGNAAIVAGAALLGHVGSPPWYRTVSVLLAALGSLSLLMFGVDSSSSSINLLPDGIWERGGVYSIIGWQLLTAACLLSRRPPQATPLRRPR